MRIGRKGRLCWKEGKGKKERKKEGGINVNIKSYILLVGIWNGTKTGKWGSIYSTIVYV